MYLQKIDELIKACKDAERAGLGTDEILSTVLPRAGHEILQAPTDFLNWAQNDAEFCIFYYDAQSQGSCAKPREAAAVILELIVKEKLGSS